MNLDATLSLEVVITILAIPGAVWRLATRIADTRRELKSDIQRLETRIDRLAERIDEIDRGLSEKIEDANLRLARLEGRFEGREERLAAGLL